jgi:predicted RNA-binding protein YlxR (DUF448 family)
MSKRERSATATESDQLILDHIEKREAEKKAQKEATFEALRIPLPKMTDEEERVLFGRFHDKIVDSWGSDSKPYTISFIIDTDDGQATDDVFKQTPFDVWFITYQRKKKTLADEWQFARDWIQEFVKDMVERWNQRHTVFKMTFRQDADRSYYICITKQKEEEGLPFAKK